MDYQKLKEQCDEVRNQIVMAELDDEKRKVLIKYDLHCNSDLYWERPKGKYPQKIFFSHKFVKKSSVIRIIFYIYQLCFAKVKYFERNWDDFLPYIHSWREGFIECELYDMELIKHKYTDIIFDLRDLKKITDIKEFRSICDYLDGQKKTLSLLN
ncbi:hypothetical protein SOV_31180 [Sporomusa ovata DSM 2662]|uniref:Uncharacterized protein n=1 Tax=Sporomusa ovata TaxID=2378 RepID=A0A0U1L1S9_9FIRM|nr:hypothetical protein [Sporomusa ovata]EQB25073.1 hypothetical protein SOV_5c02220 [Sporomusa ovata DSM 2662]CQR73622.1 hypothetical protein SpAn4DRAFT_0084 [Sporomusa ovata]